LKIGGRRSYKLARQGKEVPKIPRDVVIHEIEICREAAPDLDIRVRCGSGTYIRSIARELGERLGCGGTLAALRRTAVGPYRIERAFSMEEILRRTPDFSPTA
jgi:tRNA pseudouridine55 synthase